MPVRLTTKAEADLEAISDWIARDNPARAETFVAELRSKCDDVGRQPQVYQRLSHRDDAKLRRCVFRNYLII